LLFDAGEVPESQRAKSSIKHEVEKFNDVFKHLILESCDNAFTSKSRQDNDQNKNINDSSSVYLRSDDLISKKQVEKQCFLSTSSTSLIDLEAKYDF